jgi:hypothetical protein
MVVTLILPLPAPIGVGRIVAVDEHSDERRGEPAHVQIRDLVSGVVYRVPGSVLPEFGALPWRGRVEACTVVATEEGTVTELELDAVPVPGSGAPSGAVDALRGAQKAAEAARDQAANWGGTDHRAHEMHDRFW